MSCSRTIMARSAARPTTDTVTSLKTRVTAPTCVPVADVRAGCCIDLDWQRATVSVRGKGRRETRLPLPQDADDAGLAYLARTRPRIESDRVFFMLNAPIRPLVDSRAITGIVRGAIRKGRSVSTQTIRI